MTISEKDRTFIHYICTCNFTHLLAVGYINNNITVVLIDLGYEKNRLNLEM